MVIENCKFKKMSMRYTAENWLIEQMDFVGKIMLSFLFFSLDQGLTNFLYLHNQMTFSCSTFLWKIWVILIPSFAWKLFVFGVFPVRIFPYFPYGLNTGKYRPEKSHTNTLYTLCFSPSVDKKSQASINFFIYQFYRQEKLKIFKCG